MRIVKHDYQHTLLAAEDRVIAWAPVSMDGGKFESIRGVVKCVAGAAQNVGTAFMIMARGVVAVHPDFAASFDPDVAWDSLVPKDEAFSVTAGGNQIDVTTRAAETPTFSEPGLPNPTVLAEGDGVWGERVIDQSHILTFADVSDGFQEGSPDTYIPNIVMGFDSSKRVHMGNVPGLAMLALGTPLLTATSASIPDVLVGKEWIMLKHLHQLLEDSWKQFAGLDEAGAESPFVDIATLIVELTEPTVVEETAGAWSVASWNCWSETFITTEIPYDSVVPGTLKAG